VTRWCHRRRNFTAASLEAFRVSLVKPVAYLRYSVRAQEFLAKRIQQNMEGVTVKSFEVPQSFLDDLRAAAVPERLARQFPENPFIVDLTKAADQFGLRLPQIEKLRGAIIQGSGKEGF
jgi:hypothetical protein